MTSPTDAQIEAVARALFDGEYNEDVRNLDIPKIDAWRHTPFSKTYRRRALTAILAYEQTKKEP